MQYHRSAQDVRKFHRSGLMVFTYAGAEVVWVVARTDPEVLNEVLPRPLLKPADPLLFATVASYPETNFGPGYREGTLWVAARFRGEPGWYCLSMPVDDDMAMTAGREVAGLPKKLADEISIDRDGSTVAARVVRKGVEVLRIDGDYPDRVDARDLPWPGGRTHDPQGRPALRFTSFAIKYLPSADGAGFSHLPQLVRQVILMAPRDGQLLGSGKLTLTSSVADALGEVPVCDIVNSGYGVFDNTMLPGKVVRRIYNPVAFVPYAWFRYDMFSAIDPDSLPNLSARARRQQRRALYRY